MTTKVKIFWSEGDYPRKATVENYCLFDHGMLWSNSWDVKVHRVNTPDDWNDIFRHMSEIDLRSPSDFSFDQLNGVGFWIETDPEVYDHYILNIVVETKDSIDVEHIDVPSIDRQIDAQNNPSKYDVKKVRRRVEDALRKADPNLIIRVANEMLVKLD